MARPQAGHPTGKQITNQSWVKFDIDPWKPAPPGGPYLNTIDAGTPTSSVRPLPETVATGEFTVRWSGQDDSLGSGVGHYDIYVRTDNGPFQPWLSNTSDTAATFVGRNESRHYFYSVATDNVGWEEPAPDSFDTRTVVTGIAPPAYLSPADSSLLTDATPEFVWSATAGTYGHYRLQYSTDSTFGQCVNIPNLADTTYTVPDSLALNDSTWLWHVEAISRLGEPSGFRHAHRFLMDATAPPIPVLNEPPDDTVVADSTPTFIWSATTDSAGSYLIQLSTDSLFDSLSDAAQTRDTTHTVSDACPLDDTTYYWRVQAFDSAGNSRGYQAHPFSLTVGSRCSISGGMGYYWTPYHAIADADLVLSGGVADTLPSDSAGHYLLPSLPLGLDYLVTPEKRSSIREPAVSAFDAAMVLQHAVHRDTLDSLQFIAGDVTGNDTVSAFDAGLILQYAVGMRRHFPVGYRPGLDTVDWAFRPPQRAYDSLLSNRKDQDYTGILFGDPSGNWPGESLLLSWGGNSDGGPCAYYELNMPKGGSDNDQAPVPIQYPSHNAQEPARMAASGELESASRELSAGPSWENAPTSGAVGREPSAEFVFPVTAIRVRNAVSADILVRYDMRQLRMTGIRTTAATEGFMVAAADRSGHVRIGMAGTRELNGDVALLELVFGPAGQTAKDAKSAKASVTPSESDESRGDVAEAVSGDRLAVSREPSVGRSSGAAPTEVAVGDKQSAVSVEVLWLVLNEGASDAAGRTGEGAMGNEKKLPTSFYLAPPKPNPFGTGTLIGYGLPAATEVALAVFDAAGRRVRTLAEGTQPAGRYSLVWDGSDSKGRRLANGVYFIRMKAPKFQFQRKVTLLHR